MMDQACFLIATLILLQVVCLLVVCKNDTTFYTGLTIPDPRIDHEICGNTNASFVCDPHGVLTDVQRVEANEIMHQLTVDTTQNHFQGCNRKGLTGYVILVKSLLDDKPIVNAEMAKFALDAASKYNGDASCMKDVVILISRGDRRSYIEPNRNVGISAKTLVHVVLTQPLEHFKTGDFLKAIEVIKTGLVTKYYRGFHAELLQSILRLEKVANFVDAE